MTRTATEQAEFNEICYGCNINEFVESVEDSMTFKLAGPRMVIVSLLSDAQHELEYDMKEEARQTINRVKFLVSRYLGKDEA